MQSTEYAVVGGGLVGMAIAYGLASRGREVVVLDEADDALRASRGNFGLVWIQTKGLSLPDYSRWSQLSASLWPQLRDELTGETGQDLELKQPGGFILFLNDEEARVGIDKLTRLRDQLDGDYPFEYLQRNEIAERIPEIGPRVVGGTWFPADGHVNPLYLLQTLHRVFASLGGKLVNGATVDRIETRDDGYIVHGKTPVRAQKVVLAAGLGNARLAPQLGLNAPVVANQGQILVTERVKPFLDYPTVTVRQVGEGAVQIGDSHEDVGFDVRTSPHTVGQIAQRAVSLFPLLSDVRVVRSWAALRIMSEDGYPIYEKSTTHEGASVVTCHSGVTLAACHAKVLAGWIDSNEGPDYMERFSAKRFAAQPAA